MASESLGLRAIAVGAWVPDGDVQEEVCDAMDPMSPNIEPCLLPAGELLDENFAADEGAALLCNVSIYVREVVVAACAERSTLAVNGVVLAWAKWSSAGFGTGCCMVLTPAGWSWQGNSEPPAQCLNPLPVTI